MILKPPPTSATQMNGIIPAQLFTAPKRPTSLSKRIVLSEHDDPSTDRDKLYLHQQEQLHEQQMDKIRTYGYTWIVPLGRRKTRQEELNEEANEQDQEDDDEEASGALDGQDDEDNDSDEQRDLDASIEDLDAMDDEDPEGDEDEENDPDNLQPSTSSDDFPDRSDATDPSFMRQEYMGNLSGDISGDIDMSAMDMEGDL